MKKIKVFWSFIKSTVASGVKMLTDSMKKEAQTYREEKEQQQKKRINLKSSSEDYYEGKRKINDIIIKSISYFTHISTELKDGSIRKIDELAPDTEVTTGKENMKQNEVMFEEGHRQDDDYVISCMFPTPLYKTNWELNNWKMEKKEIEDIAKKDLRQVGELDYFSENFYLFNDNLKKLKEFCEYHIEKYVKNVLNPVDDLDFYITTSWLNVVKPGGLINRHNHANSLISGTFYPKTVEEDTVCFHDPNLQRRIHRECIAIPNISQEASSIRPYSENIEASLLAINDGDLLLFPSWLSHGVLPNEKATTDRISISFNVFVRGNIGGQGTLSELKIR